MFMAIEWRIMSFEFQPFLRAVDENSGFKSSNLPDLLYQPCSEALCTKYDLKRLGSWLICNFHVHLHELVQLDSSPKPSIQCLILHQQCSINQNMQGSWCVMWRILKFQLRENLEGKPISRSRMCNLKILLQLSLYTMY